MWWDYSGRRFNINGRVYLNGLLIFGAGSDESNTIVNIQPKTITLSGDSALLADVNKILLSSIDTTSFSSTNQYAFPIKINNELNNITGLTEAEVSVEIVGLETKSFNVHNIKFSCDLQVFPVHFRVQR